MPRHSRLKFSLLSLLGLPTCFALGWWLRGWTFERDVQATAEQIVKRSLAERAQQDAQAAENMRRRMEFFNAMRAESGLPPFGGSSPFGPHPFGGDGSP